MYTILHTLKGSSFPPVPGFVRSILAPYVFYLLNRKVSWQYCAAIHKSDILQLWQFVPELWNWGPNCLVSAVRYCTWPWVSRVKQLTGQSALTKVRSEGQRVQDCMSWEIWKQWICDIGITQLKIIIHGIGETSASVQYVSVLLLQ